jgi:poly-beta-hydroxyalkanoate depolymerase
MTLLLLTIGVIGILAVRRKKKNPKDPVQHNSAQIRSEDRSKSFIKLNKQYLKLQYKITQHKISGDSPPDSLVKEFSDLERKIRLISRALEQKKEVRPQRSLRSSEGQYKITARGG